jgi:hypothetical protein
MKLYLFGGAESSLGQVPILKDLIKQTIINISPKSLLLVPFARTKKADPDYPTGWFKELLKDTAITVYDASLVGDLEKAKGATVYINGGADKFALLTTLNTNHELRNFILNAEHVIADSAGALMMGEYLRASREENLIVKGLGIVKDTIFEGHYTELNRRELLIAEMKEKQLTYGVGIDCATGIVFSPEEFPQKWEKLGKGKVEIIALSSLQ